MTRSFLAPKEDNVNRNDVNRIELKLYEFTVIPRFTPQLVFKKGDVKRMTAKF